MKVETPPEIMKDIESQAIEYAEALNDIAEVLDMPTGATAAEIVEAASNRWANGIHTCHERCTRERCVERRKLKAMREALEGIAGFPYQYFNGETPWHMRKLAEHALSLENAERIHGGVRETKSEPASTPLDGASC